MPAEPKVKRAIAFVDGQNLFHAARETFGRSYPDYDPRRLAAAVCDGRGWALQQVRFYTGVPDAADDAFWHGFWSRKLAQIGRHRSDYTYSRPLRYQDRVVRLPDGREHTYRAGHEKGIDVRLALDVVGLAIDGAFDVALIFSQDQDLRELVPDVRRISGRERRWMRVASAFPFVPGCRNPRGIMNTDWIQIDPATYESSLDPRDYRP